MKSKSYQQKLIREELDAHIEDMVKDLISDGMDPAAAQALAERNFGNIPEIEHEVIQIHSRLAWLPWSPTAIITCLYTLPLAILVIITLTFFESIEGTVFEVFSVWSIYGGVIGLALLIELSLSHYFGWQHRSMLFISGAITMLLAISLTIIFDIDKFETNIHAAAFSVMVILIGNFLWKTIGVRVKQIIVYLLTIIVLRSIITHNPLFSFIAKPGCWFITQDTELTGALASCTQTYWWSPILLPIYLTVIISGSYAVYVLSKYLQAQYIQWYKKAGVVAFFIVMVFTPMFVNDINDEAWLDILHKKPEIYQSYQDILGRNPTDSEMQFYAQTRSYEHMNKIREVLYVSKERTQKIQLVYKEILQRKATKKELDHHAKHKDTVDSIYETLQNKKNEL